MKFKNDSYWIDFGLFPLGEKQIKEVKLENFRQCE